MKKAIVAVFCVGALFWWSAFGQRAIQSDALGCYLVRTPLMEAESKYEGGVAVLIPGFGAGIPWVAADATPDFQSPMYRNFSVLPAGSLVEVKQVFWERRFFDESLQIRGTTSGGDDRDLRDLFVFDYQPGGKLSLSVRDEVLEPCP